LYRLERRKTENLISQLVSGIFEVGQCIPVEANSNTQRKRYMTACTHLDRDLNLTTMKMKSGIHANE